MGRNFLKALREYGGIITPPVRSQASTLDPSADEKGCKTLAFADLPGGVIRNAEATVDARNSCSSLVDSRSSKLYEASSPIVGPVYTPKN